MDDKLSIKSSDSVTTSGEYEIVPEELETQSTQLLGTSPTLNIANNGNFNDLEKNLTEVIHELDNNTIEHSINTSQTTGQSNKINAGNFLSYLKYIFTKETSSSVFYFCIQSVKNFYSKYLH